MGFRVRLVLVLLISLLSAFEVSFALVQVRLVLADTFEVRTLAITVLVRLLESLVILSSGCHSRMRQTLVVSKRHNLGRIGAAGVLRLLVGVSTVGLVLAIGTNKCTHQSLFFVIYF